MAAVYGHCMAMGLELATHCEDGRVRLAEIEWLGGEAKEQLALREKQQQPKPEASGSGLVLAELRALFAKARPGQEEGPLVEVVPEGEDSQIG